MMPVLDEKAIRQRLIVYRKIDSETGCWLWTRGLYRNGYGMLLVRDRRSPFREGYVHRIAARLFLGFKGRPGEFVLHTCDVKHCFNPDHLYVGTHTSNMQDARTRHRMAGSRNGGAKLTERKVAAIRRRAARGERRAALALEFGVSLGEISMIVRELRWGGRGHS